MYLEGALELIKRGFRVDRGDLERILRGIWKKLEGSDGS